MPRGKKREFDARPLVQLDNMEDPYNERLSPRGKRRIQLNPKEKYIIKLRSVVSSFLNDGKSVPEAMQEAGLEGTPERIINLYYDPELVEFRQALVEKAVLLHLDIDASYSRADMVRLLGVTTKTFVKILESDEFQKAYNEYFLETVTDPRIKAAREMLPAFAPNIIQTLQQCLSDDAPWTVRQRTAMFLAEKLGLDARNAQESDRAALADFQGKHNLFLQQNNYFTVPPEYAGAVDETIIDAQIVAPDEAT
jgi:hypothetical protein